MIIGSSNVTMKNSRQYNAVSGLESSFTLWNTSQSLKSAKKGQESANSTKPFSIFGYGGQNGSFEQDLMDHYKSTSEKVIQNRRVNSSRERMRSLSEMRYQTLNYLLNILLGKENKKTDLLKLSDMDQSDFGGMSGSYSQTNYFSESELTTYSTTGTVVTADGRNIDFNVEVAMSRSFTEISNTNISWGDLNLTDPLVINLGSDVASVSDQKFLFDIDSDGHKEAISMLSGKSGFLALDKNHNQVIDDGSELFGTKSGNGFKDLAAYDEDGNGWIDEADSIWSDLMIWTMDKNGKNTLTALGEAGVGAIFLGSSEADFSLNNAHNETQAIMRSSGVFLFEDGRVGTLQQIDMAMRE